MSLFFKRVIMSNYKEAVRKVMKSEGGYVNDPDDPGGETYIGVTRVNYTNWEGCPIIDMIRQESVGEGDFKKNLKDSSELTEMVEKFYKTYYWDTIKGDDIDNQNIAECIFDFGVNVGVDASSKIAQVVVESKPDGIIGNNTLDAISKSDPDEFLMSFTCLRIARYAGICKRRPISEKYLLGWINRSLEVVGEILEKNPDEFIVPFTLLSMTRYIALLRIARYREICKRRPINKKNLLEWINSSLGRVQ